MPIYRFVTAMHECVCVCVCVCACINKLFHLNLCRVSNISKFYFQFHCLLFLAGDLHLLLSWLQSWASFECIESAGYVYVLSNKFVLFSLSSSPKRETGDTWLHTAASFM